MGGMDLDWLIRNRFAFGLALTVRGERWHFEAEGVDYLTGRRCPAPTVRIIPHPSTLSPKDWFDMATEAELRKIIREEIQAETGPIRAALADLAVGIGRATTYARQAWARVRAEHEITLTPEQRAAVSQRAGELDDDAARAERA